MTIVEETKAQQTLDDPQLLFQEAKQRRRRRWLVSGLATLIVLLVVGVTLGLSFNRDGQNPLKPAGLPASLSSSGGAVANLSFRPVLCYAPPLTVATGQTASSGPLPSCSPAMELSASNLRVEPNSSNLNGYSSNTNLLVDPQFATYPSTTSTNDIKGTSVLLPGDSAEGDGRYVLGPAALTQQDVKSASAQLIDGQWTIKLSFTSQGSTEWDALTNAQFHSIIGVVLNGQVISAPITQPTQSSWTSFG